MAYMILQIVFKFKLRPRTRAPSKAFMYIFSNRICIVLFSCLVIILFSGMAAASLAFLTHPPSMRCENMQVCLRKIKQANMNVILLNSIN